MEHNKNGTRKLSRTKIIIIILVAVILLAVGITVALGYNLLNSISRPTDPVFSANEGDILITPAPAIPTHTPAPEATPLPTPLPMAELYNQTILDDAANAKLASEAEDERFINVLLIGVDRRSTKGNSNTDTMMIATIDTVNNRLKLTSIMRDTLVNIPGYGYAKLNSAAVKGGTELLFETLNTNFKLALSEYVLVDFSMFEAIVDELGGITVKMTAEEISAANDCIAGLNKQRGIAYTWDGFIFANEGNVKLTGKQALGFARVRKIDSDLSRTKRQFKLLNSVFALFMKADASKQYQLMEKLMPMIETNMTNERIISCATKALGMNANGLVHFRIPADELYESTKYERKSVILADIPANALALHDFIFASVDAPEEAKVLTPGESLPPRTPTIYQGEDGNYYYYANNMPVYDVIDPLATPDPNAFYATTDPNMQNEIVLPG